MIGAVILFALASACYMSVSYVYRAFMCWPWLMLPWQARGYFCYFLSSWTQMPQDWVSRDGCADKSLSMVRYHNHIMNAENISPFVSKKDGDSSWEVHIYLPFHSSWNQSTSNRHLAILCQLLNSVNAEGVWQANVYDYRPQFKSRCKTFDNPREWLR